jgi:hypothetical protein
MILQMTLHNERFITDNTGKCPLLTMYSFQFIQSTLKRRGNNIKNPSLKRNKIETEVQYEVTWVQMGG